MAAGVIAGYPVVDVKVTVLSGAQRNLESSAAAFRIAGAAAFHEGVACLPAEEREVVSLIFYHGWTQVEVADLFQINERTVRRPWESALVKLRGLREVK